MWHASVTVKIVVHHICIARNTRLKRDTSSKDVKSLNCQQGSTRHGMEFGLHELLKGLSCFPRLNNYLRQLGEIPATTTSGNDDWASFSSLVDEPSAADGSSLVASCHTSSHIRGAVNSSIGANVRRRMNGVTSVETVKMFFGSNKSLYSPVSPQGKVMQER